jgi:hypothetical protein
LKNDSFSCKFAKPKRLVSYFISKNFKKHESSKEIIIVATLYYLVFIGVFNLLSKRFELEQALLHFCFPFKKNLGQVIHLCRPN